MELLGRYKNGNVITTIYSDGTKVRSTQEDDFRPAFAENMDIKICNRCDKGCPWCHEGSTSDGKLGDIMNEKFIETLHPFQEVALGGGNVLEHPDLIPFLHKLKDKKVITNITLQQCHFEEHIDLVDKMISHQLIYGLGVSLVNPTVEFIEKIKKYPNAVIHVINGIVSENDISVMSNQNIKLLILGYKKLRRGAQYFVVDQNEIEKNQNWFENNISELINEFAVISFDNLAIEQLHLKEKWDKLSDKEWDEFYAGDDGTNTYYIDMVERKFARSSTAVFDKRYDLLDNVDDMFKVILREYENNE